MRSAILILASIFYTFNISSQSLGWVNSGAGIVGEVRIYNVQEHKEDVYLTGFVNGPGIVVAGQNFDVDTQSFLAKFSKNGELDWFRPMPLDRKTNFIINSNDEIIVAHSGFLKSFIYKYDLDGNLIFEKQLIPDGIQVNANSIISDSEDAVIVAGKYSLFDEMIVEDTIISNLKNRNNGFIIKYNKDNIFEWFETTDGGEICNYKELKVDSENNIVAVGDYNSYDTDSLEIGDFRLAKVVDTTYVGSLVSQDIVVAKYSSSGGVIWAKSYGGYLDDYVNDISFNSNNDIHIVGTYSKNVFFEDQEFIGEGVSDIFLAKIKSNGVLDWAQSAGGPIGGGASHIGFEAGRSIANDEFDNVFVSGGFFDFATFGDGDNQVTISNPSGRSTLFLVKYSSEGELSWVSHSNSQQAEIYSLDYSANKIYMAGLFRNDVNYDGVEFPIFGGTNQLSHFFVGKVNLDGAVGIPILNELDVNLFPNPTENYLNISFPEEFINNGTIQLLELSGTILFDGNIHSQNMNLDLSKCNPGIYLIKLNSENRTAVKKVIKIQ